MNGCSVFRYTPPSQQVLQVQMTLYIFQGSTCFKFRWYFTPSKSARPWSSANTSQLSRQHLFQVQVVLHILLANIGSSNAVVRLQQAQLLGGGRPMYSGEADPGTW